MTQKEGQDLTDPFVLNASGTNQTQLYMVPLEELGTFDPGTVSPSTPVNATAPSNSTAGGNSTSPSNTPGAAAASFDTSIFADSATNSTDSSNSTVPADAPSLPFKKVTLQLPVFDPESVSVKRYCATFDPRPSAPSPLTVESCDEAVLQGQHKSQMFAFYPASSVIQPMWFEGEDEDLPADSDDSDSDSQGTGSGGPDVTQPSGNSTVSEVDPTADVSAAVARIENLNKSLLSDASNAHNFAAEEAPSGSSDIFPTQNVTMIFNPGMVMLPVAGDIPVQQQADDPSTISSAPTATSSDPTSTSTSSTDGTSDSVTTVAATDSARATVSSTDSAASTTVTFSLAAAPTSDPSSS